MHQGLLKEKDRTTAEILKKYELVTKTFTEGPGETLLKHRTEHAERPKEREPTSTEFPEVFKHKTDI